MNATDPKPTLRCKGCCKLFFVLEAKTDYCNDCYGHHLQTAPQREAWIARGRPMRRDPPRQRNTRVGLRFDDDLHNDMTERDFDPDIGDR